MTRRCPALLVAAPSSGQGKTPLAASYVHLHFPSNPKAAARLFLP